MKSLPAVESCLDAIAARDGELHAWQAVDAEFARRHARRAARCTACRWA